MAGDLDILEVEQLHGSAIDWDHDVYFGFREVMISNHRV
jgi:hypothetical protein